MSYKVQDTNDQKALLTFTLKNVLPE